MDAPLLYINVRRCKVFKKVCPMRSRIVVMRYPNLFEFSSPLGNVRVQIFKHIPMVFLVYCSFWCHIVLLNKAMAIEECDEHHLSLYRLLSDFSLLRKRLLFQCALSCLVRHIKQCTQLSLRFITFSNKSGCS